jgi:hypothetical protein
MPDGLMPYHMRTVGQLPVPNISKVVSSGNPSDWNFTRDTNYLDRFVMWVSSVKTYDGIIS